jgi:hypothetical protein
MGLPNKDFFNAVLDAAITEAADIIADCKADPKKYIQPRIGAWGAKYTSSRYEGVYNTVDRGKLDLIDQDAEIALKSDFPGITATPVDFRSFTDGEATGEAVGADAATRQLNRIKTMFTPTRVDMFYKTYEIALETQNRGAAESVYANCFRAAELEFHLLYNTMIRKMEQGEKPPLVAGPGQHVVHTPFGDTVVNDSPFEMPPDNTFLGSVTVGQLKQILSNQLKLIKQ